MSRSALVWLSASVDLDDLLPDVDGWASAGVDGRVLDVDTSQIWAGQVDSVDPEDVPSELSGLAASATHLVVIGLEGSSRGRAGAAFRRACATVAAAGGGVVDDSHSRHLTDADGVRHERVRPGVAHQVDVLKLSWFWADPLAGYRELVELIGRTAPAVLPQRYGLWEPPQSRVNPQDLSDIAAFLDEHVDDFVVLYGGRYVYDIDLATPGGLADPPETAVCRLTIAVDIAAVRRDRLGARLAELLVAAAEVTRSFYAEARVLRGFALNGRHDLTEVPFHTDLDPIRGNLWYGLPHQPPAACVIGPLYRERWPALEVGGHARGYLAAAVPDSLPGNLRIQEAPMELRQSFDRHWAHITSHGYPGATIASPDE